MSRFERINESPAASDDEMPELPKAPSPEPKGPSAAAAMAGPASEQRVLRYVSEVTQGKVRDGRGPPGNRICGVCQQVSASRRDHARHVAGHYTRFYCRVCGWSSSRLSEVRLHQDCDAHHRGVMETDQPAGYLGEEANIRRLEEEVARAMELPEPAPEGLQKAIRRLKRRIREKRVSFGNLSHRR